jgi:hypothetical protein
VLLGCLKKNYKEEKKKCKERKEGGDDMSRSLGL